MNRNWLLKAFIIGLAAPGALCAADAPRGERGGKAVVDAVCSRCHAGGAEGAPRIGDAPAWQDRAKRGLSSLTQSAIKGIRNMPAHGGSAEVSDLELARAIAYMVNQSGGKWVEPAGPSARADRTGKQVVEMRCANCHESGKGGAPRIGDKAAWIPRLDRGLDAAVRSAIHGHGGMPARGGIADFSDAEIRGAVVYMFNPDSPARK